LLPVLFRKEKKGQRIVMSIPFKIVIPMAGVGARMRPLTWSRPKQLVSVAGKPILDHVLDSLASLPDPKEIELIGIVGYLGDQIEKHLVQHFPQLKTHIVVQENPRGQSHAIQLAREYLQEGPMLLIFADTLIDTDLSFLADEKTDSVAWVHPVSDPRRFGVAELNGNGFVRRLIEKPQEITNNLAVVGCYYFKDPQMLLSAIDEQIRRNLVLKGEYYLADAVNIMLEWGLKMRVKEVDTWLDAGTPDALLETNRYLLEHGKDNSAEAAQRNGVVIVPPVFVHPTAQVEKSILGPHVSVGAGCRIENSLIQNSILEEEAQATGVILECSLVGRRAELHRRAGIVTAGDNTIVTL
jgi:glucose-1-phosphate thymidylyltransferase